MFTVHQPTMFSRDLVLYDGDSPAIHIRFRIFSGGAEIGIGTTSYDAICSGWVRRIYKLERNNSVVASAEPVGFWQRTYEVRAGSSVWTLRRQSGWFETGWDLLSGDTEIGSVTRTGFFRTVTSANFHDSVDIPVQAFVVWVVNVIWQQDQSAAVDAAAG